MPTELPAPVPLGPASILGGIVTDPRISFTGFTTGLLQLMHPAVSAAVIDQGEFFKNPFDRVYRSVPRIVASVVADDSQARAVQVRDYHRDIKGVDPQGRRYHALDPDAYWWTHMCFVWGFLQAADVFRHRRLTSAERTQYYAESVEWWRRYGMSMRLVPPDLESFLAEFDRRCAEDVEWTPAVAGALDVKVFRAPLPAPFDRLIGAPTTPMFRLAMMGTMPAIVRERFDLPWSAADQLAYLAFARSVGEAGRFVPQQWIQRVATTSIKRMGNRTQLTSTSV